MRRCGAFVERGGAYLAKSRRHVERRHRNCRRKATTTRVVWEREIQLCGHHALQVDRGRPINTKSDW